VTVFDDFDFEAAFQAPMTFDWSGQFQALTGLGPGHHFFLAADCALHWAQASKLLEDAGIEHDGHPLAGGSCLFTVAEEDGERAERLLERYGGFTYRPPLDDLTGLFT
jgi:hypothetical protein